MDPVEVSKLAQRVRALDAEIVAAGKLAPRGAWSLDSSAVEALGDLLHTLQSLLSEERCWCGRNALDFYDGQGLCFEHGSAARVELSRCGDCPDCADFPEITKQFVYAVAASVMVRIDSADYSFACACYELAGSLDFRPESLETLQRLIRFGEGNRYASSLPSVPGEVE